jgi:hypothetical protein
VYEYASHSIDEDKSITIMEGIWMMINKSRFLVADITDTNPNVLYELGIAHTLGKGVITISEKPDYIPFDIAGCTGITQQNFLLSLRCIHLLRCW